MYVIRQVRIGLATVLLFGLAFVAFTYLWGGTLWTGRSASSRDEYHVQSTSQPVVSAGVGASSDPHQDDGKATKPSSIPHVDVQPVANLTQLPHEKKRPIVKAPVHTAHKSSPMIHVRVRAGQSLWELAQMYRTTVANIESTNHLQSTILQIGQPLRIPTDTHVQVKTTTQAHSSTATLIYTVQTGDSLWKISTEYGVSIAQLTADNHLQTAFLHVGQKLSIDSPRPVYHPSTASEKLIQAAPSSLIPVYKAAGQKYNIPWTVLAAIHKEETDFDTTGTLVSYVGALGPMQFMPSTFAIYGVPAPGHRVASIYNVYDAIYSTAHMLAAQGFSLDPYHAIYAYNHSTTYVDDILRMSST
jgi:LysM repeat protein